MPNWLTKVIKILRHYISDTDATNYEYTDERLRSIIVIAAQYLVQEVEFDNEYTVDLINEDVDPDPSDDVAFINLLALRSAILFLENDLRIQSVRSVRVINGPVAIDATKSLDSIRAILEHYKRAYEELRNNFVVNNLDYKAIVPPHGE